MKSRKTQQTDQASTGKPQSPRNSPDDSFDDDKAFQELLGDHLMKWDASINPPTPALSTLEQLVSEQKQLISRRIWRDLLMLWVIGGLVISGMLLLFQHNRIVFVVVQAVFIIAAAIFLILTQRSKFKEGQYKWNN
jgi:tetrahydromethanopterin S-methyltransferase subunit G